jgi:hypothetical protein
MAVLGGLRVIKVARRVAPLAAEAYRRWNQLSPEEKERYKARARQYAARGQAVGREALLRAERLQAQQKQQRKKRR